MEENKSKTVARGVKNDVSREGLNIFLERGEDTISGPNTDPWGGGRLLSRTR
jgi:hypothetical protein